MTTKTLRLSDARASKISVASAAHMLSTEEFIRIAVDDLLEVCADHDSRLALMFAYIDGREAKPETVTA
jgi:chloramphenicol 3-O-phosphotransferase